MPTQSVLKVTLFFNMQGQGWSEVYYFNGSDPIAWLYGTLEPTTPSLGGPNVRLLLGRRGGLMPPVAGINAIRVSLDGQPHVAGGINFGFPGYTGDFAKQVSPTQLSNLPPYERVLCKSYWQVGGLTFYANHYLGGLPGPLVTTTDVFFPDGDWLKIFENFVAAMKTLGWVEKQRPAAAAATPMIGFQPSADGLTAQVGPVPVGIVAPGIYSVLIRSLKVPHGWNGQHRAVATAAGLAAPVPFITIGPLRKAGVSTPPWSPANPGTIQNFLPTYQTVATMKPVRLVKKDTGRPFGLPVGRRTRA